MKFANECMIETEYGKFTFCVDDTLNDEIYIIRYGNWNDLCNRPLVRMHSACCFSEIFGDMSCDCKDQLKEAMKLIAQEEKGIIFYLKQEGRGQGIINKTKAIGYMQHKKCNTDVAYRDLSYEIDSRDYREVAAILLEKNITSIKLLTNNPSKIAGLKQEGIDVETVNFAVPLQKENFKDVLVRNFKHNHIAPDIRFGSRHEKFGFLSNLSSHSIKYKHPNQKKTTVWPTVEHAYQACKFEGEPEIELIRKQTDPLQAKKVSYDNQLAWKKDWERQKVKIMRSLLSKKIKQHKEIEQNLLLTHTSKLIESSENDLFWGQNSRGDGENKLGKLWVELREGLKETNPLNY